MIVTDEDLLAKLNEGEVGGPVSDPNLLEQLNAPTVPPVAAEGLVGAPTASEPDFAQRMRAILDKRQAQQSGAFEKAFDGSDAGPLAAAKLLAKTAGNTVVGTAADVAGELVATGLDAVVPEHLQRTFKSAMASVAEAGMGTDTVQWMMKEWDGLSKDQQDLLAAGGNLFGAFLTKMPKNLFKGKNVEAKGIQIKRNKLSEALKAPETPKTKELDHLAGYKEGQRHRDAVDEAMKVKGVSPNKSPRQNGELISTKVTETKTKLDKQLADNPVDVSNKELLENMEDAIDNVRANNEWIGLDEAHEKAFEQHIATARRILRKHPQTAEGILAARREFDDVLYAGGKSSLELGNVKDAAGQAMRDGMNRTVIQAGAKVGVDVASAQLIMHNLLNANASLALKAGKFKPLGAKVMGQLQAHPYLVLGAGTLPALAVPLAATAAVFQAGKRVLPSAVGAAGKALDPRAVGLGGLLSTRTRGEEQ